MFSTNPVQNVDEYAKEAEQEYKQAPTPDQTLKGVIPLDSLPAQWWNYLWNQLTSQERNTVSAINHMMQELVNVCTEGDVTPSDVVDDQVKLAILNIVERERTKVATTTALGTVKASDEVAVADDGVMSTPKIGDLSALQTVLKDTIVTALNEVVSNVGLLDTLTTSNKDSLVKAVNEVVSNVGLLDTLTTSNKDSLVKAVNEVQGEIGDLGNLDDETATNLVDAINNVSAAAHPGLTNVTAADGIYYYYCGSYTMENIGAAMAKAKTNTRATEARLPNVYELRYIIRPDSYSWSGELNTSVGNASNIYYLVASASSISSKTPSTSLPVYAIVC